MKKGSILTLVLFLTFLINIIGVGTLNAFAADEVVITAPRTGDFITDKYNVNFTVNNSIKPANIRLVYFNDAGYETSVQIEVKKETTATSQYTALIDKIKEGTTSIKVIVSTEDKKEFSAQTDVNVSKVLTNIMLDNVNVEPYTSDPNKFKNELKRMNGIMADSYGIAPIDNSLVSKFVDTVVTVANKEGVRPDVAMAQMMLETGWLTFPGDVSSSQNNFGGMGATGGVAGNLFDSLEEGVRSHIQHLLAYASTQAPTEAIADPRFHYVTRGISPYVEYLGIKENPSNVGWAMGFQYGRKILIVLDKLKAASDAPFDSSIRDIRVREVIAKPVDQTTVSTGAINRVYGENYNVGSLIRIGVATTSDTQQSFKITNLISGKSSTIPYTEKSAVDFTPNETGPYKVEVFVRANGSTSGYAATDSTKIDISGDYVLVADVNGYETAENAISGNNKITTLKKGTYRFTEESGGAYLLDTPDGTNYWINPNDNKVISSGSTTTPVTTTPVQNGTYTLVRDVKAYSSAIDAINRTNAKTTYYKGTYYIYKIASGVYNISKTQGTPGAWINPGDNVITGSTTTPANTTTPVTTQPSTTSPATTTPVPAAGGTYILYNDVKGYTTSLDAINRVNPVATYTKGTYYIYKIANGVYNISRTKGSAGVWINPGDNKTSSGSTTPATITPVTTTPSTTTVTKTITQPVVTAAPSVGGKYVLNNDVKGYRTAADAYNRVNPVKIYMKGTFYVYKIYDGMLNLSTVQGSAGAWINPGDNKPRYETVTVTVPASTTTSTTTPKTTSATTAAPVAGGKYTLNNDVRSYKTASDALNRINSTGIYTKGIYYIYKIFNSMFNISRTSGTAGAWINPNDNKPLTQTAPVSTTTPKTTTAATTTPVTTTAATTSASGKYVVYTDLRSYMNADDARNRVNPVGTYKAGTYYVYRSVTGAINISTTQGSAGAWINPQDNKAPLPQVGASYQVIKDIPGYTNANDAKLGVNSYRIVKAGSYKIYKIYDGMLNITTVSGTPGVWINPDKNR